MAGHALVGGFFAVRDIRACEKRLDRLLGLRLNWLVFFGRAFRHRDLVSGLKRIYWRKYCADREADSLKAEEGAEDAAKNFVELKVVLESNDFSWGEKIGKYPYSAGFVGPD